MLLRPFFFFFFFNDTATTEIYTLSLHDALPISLREEFELPAPGTWPASDQYEVRDRKSTRLNSSHLVISYAVFCLKKKKKTTQHYNQHYISNPSHAITTDARLHISYSTTQQAMP